MLEQLNVHFQAPCKWSRELERISEQLSGLCYRTEVEVLLTFTSRSLSVDFYFLQNNQLQTKCSVSDDVQSQEESGGVFFCGLIGTVIPWRLSTETKLILFEERRLTVSLEMGWGRQDRNLRGQPGLLWSSSRPSSGGPSFGVPKSCPSHCAQKDWFAQ